MHLLVEEGMTQKQIALQLNRDLITIKRHSQAIWKRLGGVTMHQAVAIAAIYGWVSPPQRGEPTVTIVTVELESARWKLAPFSWPVQDNTALIHLIWEQTLGELHVPNS